MCTVLIVKLIHSPLYNKPSIFIYCVAYWAGQYHLTPPSTYYLKWSMTKRIQRTLTWGEVESLYSWPHVYLVWIQLALLTYVELAIALLVWSNPNQSNRRSAIQWYFLPKCSLLYYFYMAEIARIALFKSPSSSTTRASSTFFGTAKRFRLMLAETPPANLPPFSLAFSLSLVSVGRSNSLFQVLKNQGWLLELLL